MGWTYIAVLMFLVGYVMFARYTPVQLLITIIAVLFLWACFVVYMVPN